MLTIWRFILPTPSYQWELEHVSAEVRSENSDDAQVHVQGLKPRPGKWCKQEVVQEEGSANAQPNRWVQCQPAVQQEDKVEEEEGEAELNQDLGRNIPHQFSA